MNQKTTRQDLSMQLLNAAESGDLARVQLLIHEGADIHAEDDGALRIAARSGHLEVVRLLLHNGANIHTDRDYALCWASENGHTEITVLLFNQAPDYYATLIKKDNKLSTDESLHALANHYRLGSHFQSDAAPRVRRAL